MHHFIPSVSYTSCNNKKMNLLCDVKKCEIPLNIIDTNMHTYIFEDALYDGNIQNAKKASWNLLLTHERWHMKIHVLYESTVEINVGIKKLFSQKTCVFTLERAIVLHLTK